MCSRLLVTLLMLAQVALALATQPVAAQSLVDPRSRERGQDYAKQTGGMSLDEAVRMVESRYRARAVKVDTVSNGGRRVYEIRLLNAEGKVWKVRVDAETGQSS